MYLSQKIDTRLTLDPGLRHPGFEFVGRHERAGGFETLPLEQQSQVIDVTRTVKDSAAAFPVLAAPVQSGFKRRFPCRIVGHFMMDEDIDHDVRGYSFWA